MFNCGSSVPPAQKGTYRRYITAYRGCFLLPRSRLKPFNRKCLVKFALVQNSRFSGGPQILVKTLQDAFCSKVRFPPFSRLQLMPFFVFAFVYVLKGVACSIRGKKTSLRLVLCSLIKCVPPCIARNGVVK
jgi:hypothetical protein